MWFYFACVWRMKFFMSLAPNIPHCLITNRNRNGRDIEKLKLFFVAVNVIIKDDDAFITTIMFSSQFFSLLSSATAIEIVIVVLSSYEAGSCAIDVTGKCTFKQFKHFTFNVHFIRSNRQTNIQCATFL